MSNYQDIFWTSYYTKVTLYTLNFNATPSISTSNINFTFGTLYYAFTWQHAQLTNANNYQYNFRDIYNKTKNNGTQIIINAYGNGNQSNSADWLFKQYKF